MKIKHFLFALAAPVVIAAPADAAVYTFDLSGSFSANWTIDTVDMVDGYTEEGQGFGFYDVSGLFNGRSATTTSINFFSADNSGGLSIELPNSIPFFTGPALYTGAEANRQFRIGTFELSDGARMTITDTAAAVPEPATWAMMVLGLGAVGGALRARRRVNVAVRFA